MTKILFVEDETVISLSVGFILEAEGYEVIVASNGEEALVKLKQENPDLIITDYMMPRMDGLEFIATLRDEGYTIPIVLATSVPQERIDHDPRAQYDAFLPKPYMDYNLLDMVRRMTGGESSKI